MVLKAGDALRVVESETVGKWCNTIDSSRGECERQVLALAANERIT